MHFAAPAAVERRPGAKVHNGFERLAPPYSCRHCIDTVRECSRNFLECEIECGGTKGFSSSRTANNCRSEDEVLRLRASVRALWRSLSAPLSMTWWVTHYVMW